jgi:hypothetical protein
VICWTASVTSIWFCPRTTPVPVRVTKYGGVPPYAETRAYIPKVAGRYEELKRLGAVTPPPVPPSPYKLRGDSSELRLIESRN